MDSTKRDAQPEGQIVCMRESFKDAEHFVEYLRDQFLPTLDDNIAELGLDTPGVALSEAEKWQMYLVVGSNVVEPIIKGQASFKKVDSAFVVFGVDDRISLQLTKKVTREGKIELDYKVVAARNRQVYNSAYTDVGEDSAYPLMTNDLDKLEEYKK